MASRLIGVYRALETFNSNLTRTIAVGNFSTKYSGRLISQVASVRRYSNDVEKPGSKTSKTGESSDEVVEEEKDPDPFAPFPNDVNPVTKEKGGPKGPEPTRYGDWERKGRCIDF